MYSRTVNNFLRNQGYFDKIFYANVTPMQNVLPISMLTPFTSSGIREAVWTTKINKCPGMDQINVESMRYLPEVVYKKSQICTTTLQPQDSIQMKSHTEF